MREREPTLDNGLTATVMTESLQRVYVICIRGWTAAKHDATELADLYPTKGWEHVGALMFATLLASESADQTFKPADLAENCYNNFYRGATGQDPPVPYSKQTVRERLAWESVGRHAATVGHMDEIVGLPAIEFGWGSNLATVAQNRGMQLEPVKPGT